MTSNLARRLMGETASADAPPVLTGAPAAQASAADRTTPSRPEEKKKARNRVVSGIMGRLKEDRDGAVIPNDAKEVKTIDQNDHGLDLKQPEIPGQKVKNPYSGEEPLILPAASLVAPDVTPEAIHPIDPTKLPGADQGRKPEAAAAAPAAAPQTPPGESTPVTDLLLGKTPGPAQSSIAPPPAGPTSATNMSSERFSGEAISRLPGIPSPDAFVASEAATTAVKGGQVTLRPGQAMPDHVPGDGGRTVLEAFSRFVPRGSMK